MKLDIPITFQDLLVNIGCSQTQRIAHTSKAIADVAKSEGEMTDWFRNGVDAALLAPTAMNQQKFSFTQHGNKVFANAGIGFYTKVDLGIAKYHFEIGAGKENFK